MNRLQKKCFLAASGLHLLLVVILIVGPAFLAGRDKADDVQILEFVPMTTTDKPFAGGGSPKATPPPAPAPVAPTPPTPAPAAPPQAAVKPPTPEPTPEPQKVTPPEPAKKDPETLEPAKVAKPRKPKPDVSTTLVQRKDVKTTPKKSTATSDAEAKAEAKAEAQRQKAFQTAARSLREGLSSSTQVEMPGPGGGGPTYARFKDVLATVYYNAWILPNDLDDSAPTVGVVVYIAPDGSVVSARITRPSGNAALDRSVQSALDRVKFIAPLPEGSVGNRECNINFNPQAKQSLG